MKVTVLYGTGRQGTTWRLTQLFLAGLTGAEVTEFYLPRDFGAVCTGCIACIAQGEERCPHKEQMHPILSALDEADLIVMASPTYVFGEAAGLRAVWEHLAWRWMVHRPAESMFSKVGVSISTAAGPCTRWTLKNMDRQFWFWGVARTFRWGEAVGGGWDYLSEEKQRRLECRAVRLARKVNGIVGRAKPRLRTRVLFRFMRQMQRRGWSGQERTYWTAQGWMDGTIPW